MTYEQRLTELGLKPYAQLAVDGSYMGSASCTAGMSAFAGAPTREAGFMRVWTDLMVGRILRTAGEGSPLNFTYRALLKSAHGTRVIAPSPSKKAFDLRNRAMVDDCDLLIAIWDGSPGGTANCVEYAERVLRPTLFLKPGFILGEP
mgnify:CR=1 FL=1